jgi:anti-sigma-K factor RskA
MFRRRNRERIMAEFEKRDGTVRDTRHSSTPAWLIAILVVAALVVAAFAFGFINIDQTKTAKLPDVKVETSGGQAPAFDVDTAKIDVGTKEETIKVPTVTMEKAKDAE